jgi:serine/threonine-protein phosphatase 2B catalytic subunit
MPHPYYLPNFMDAFTWSLPFVAEKVTDIYKTILVLSHTEGEETKEVSINKEKGDIIKAKLLGVGKMARMVSTLKTESANIKKIKNFNNGLIPKGNLFKFYN